MRFEEKKRLCSWLNHEAYDKATASYGLLDWGQAFYFRAAWDYLHILPEVKNYALNKLGELGSFNESVLKEMKLEYLTSLAILDEEPEDFFHPTHGTGNYEAVFSLTAGAAMGFAHSIAEDKEIIELSEGHVAEWFNSWKLPASINNKPAHLIGSEKYDDLGKAYEHIAYAGIDVLAPDKVIIDGLMKWLPQIRADLKIDKFKTEFTEADMKKWRDNRLLQYMDLILFSKESNVELTSVDMGRILFPHEDGKFNFDTTEKIRKTVKPDAERMFTENMASRICSQANMGARGKAV